MTGSDGILVESLRKVFAQTVEGTAVVAIERLDFRIDPGEMVAIVGQTGCGKSTFLNILLGLDFPSEGSITIGGRTPYRDFHHFKGRIAAIFQQDRLLPWRTALDNAKFGLELLGYTAQEQVARARVWLERLGLGHCLTAYPHELSGGMRQRVALARAFAVGPELLLADEAFGHLDEVTAAALRKSFVELARNESRTAVLVTHQLEEAIEMGDRILVFGRPAKLLADIQQGSRSGGDLQGLRASIQQLIQTNERDPDLTRGERPR